MGTVLSNLKARFGVDNSDFRKGLKDGEKALSDFKDVGKDQLSEFADIFNINMTAVSSALNTAGKSLNFIGQSFKAAKGGGDAFAIAMKGVKTALAATGIGALILALGSLIAYFKETETGARQLASGMGQVKAVWESVKDRFASFGSGLVNMFQGNFVLGIQDMSDAFDKLGGREKEAAYRGKEAAAMQYEYNKQMREFIVRKSELLVKMDQERLKSKDLELTTQEQLNQLLKSSETEKQINREALDLAAQKILIAQKNLESDQDNVDLKEELARAYADYNQTVRDSIQYDLSLARQKNALIKQLEAEKKAQDDLLKSMKEANAINKIQGIGIGQISTPGLANMPSYQGKQAMKEIGDAAQDMASTVETSFEDMISSAFEFVGSFQTAGAVTAKTAGNLVGNAFGDMMINLGKVAIQTGIGVEAIKTAFSSLSGIGAIAIGAGLITFGTMIKGAVRDVGTGGSGTINSGGAGGSFVYDTRTAREGVVNVVRHEVDIRFTGKELKAALDYEDTRRGFST